MLARPPWPSRRCGSGHREEPLGRAVRAAIEATAAQDEDRWHEASSIAVEHGLRLVAVDALEGLAGVAAAASESWAECLRLAAAAARLRDETGYRWRFAFEQDRLDAAVAAATEALGPEQAERRDGRGRGVGLARSRRLRGSGSRRAPTAEPRVGRADTNRAPGRHARRRRPHEPTDRRATPHGSRHREDPPRPRLHQDRPPLTDRARRRVRKAASEPVELRGTRQSGRPIGRALRLPLSPFREFHRSARCRRSPPARSIRGPLRQRRARGSSARCRRSRSRRE